MALLLVLALSACGAAEADAPPELLVPITVQTCDNTAVATRGSIAHIIRISGIVRADSVPLDFGATAGRFSEFYVLLGDAVYEGQLLARLDFTQVEERITRQEERITIMRTRNTFNNQLRSLDLDIRSHINAIAMQSAADSNDTNARLDAEAEARAIQDARTELVFTIEQQALALRHEEEYLISLQQQYARSELFAPVAGTITYKADITAGSWVAPFSDILHILPEDAPVFIEYTGGTNVPRVPRIRANIGAAVYDLTRIEVSSEEVQRLGRAPVRYTIGGQVLYPMGTFAAIYVYSIWEEDVLRIPRNALFFDPDVGFYVYRVEDSQLTMVYVAIGRRTEAYAAIASGLEEGDVVYVRR